MCKVKECKVCKRFFEVNSYYFNITKLSKDGFSGKCRECQYDKLIFVEDGYKVCRKCQIVLPKENKYFYFNKTYLDGFNNDCRVCQGYTYEEDVNSELKKCKVCELEFERSSKYFHINNERLDGFSSKCKKCSSCKDIKIDNIEDWYNNKSVKFKNNWTLDDIIWLYENYLTKEKKDILSYFNNSISYKTITNLVYNMGIRKTEKNDVWSKSDIELLKEHYPNKRRDYISSLFKNRTWEAIAGKASKLGIKREDEARYIEASISHKGHKMSDETRRKMSLRMSGSNSPNWKGGASNLNRVIRSYTTQWKLESLKKYDYKCAITGVNDGTLQIHHSNKNFSEIMYETFEVLNLEIKETLGHYSDEEIIKIRNKIVELHDYYGTGIPLTTKIHKLFHKIYGNCNNTYEQVLEFKKDYIDGKYDYLIN